MSQPVAGGSQVEAQGREINATLTMRDNAPWLANVRYLYFNPASASGQNATENVAPQTATRLDFHGWPDLQLRCAECWLWGQKYGRIDGDVAIKGDTLTLSNGLGGYRVWPADDQRRVGERPFRGSNLAERQTARQ